MEFIDYRRRDYEVQAMISEIGRRCGSASIGLAPSTIEDVPAKPVQAETNQAAVQRMMHDGAYIHAAFQPPPENDMGKSKSKRAMQQCFDRIKHRLGRDKETYLAERCYPIRLSDASCADSAVEKELRKGLVHTLVWCAKGDGWEDRSTAEGVPSLSSLLDILQALPRTCEPPRVAVVCLQYGAMQAAQRLRQCGIANVIWLTADMSADSAVPVFCNVISAAIKLLHDKDSTVEQVDELLDTRLSGLKLHQTADGCGCIGTGQVAWEPAQSSSEHWWCRSLIAPPLASENFEHLRKLDILASDLVHMQKLRQQLQERGRLLVVTNGSDITGAAVRRRSVAHTLCTSFLHDTCYEHLHRVTTGAEMEDAEKSICGTALVWVDILSQSSTAEDLECILNIWESLDGSQVNIIVTIDDGFEDSNRTRRLLERLDPFDLGSERGVHGVLANELVEDVKINLSFDPAPPGVQPNLLDVFTPDQLVEATQRQVQDRPIVAIYRADDNQSVWIRLSFTDVGFCHILRDHILSGTFGKEMQETLASFPRNHPWDELGSIRVDVDRSQFAARYATSILALDKLTPHQTDCLDDCLDTTDNIALKACAGAGKTFVAMSLMMKVMEDDTKRVMFVARNPPLAMSVAKWVASRCSGSAQRDRTLSQLHLLFTDFDEGPREVKLDYETSMLVTKPASVGLHYDLQVVDEAHHIYGTESLRRVVDECDCARRVLLSDISQGLVSDIKFPTGLKEIKLTECVRSSKRIVAGAMQFQLKGNESELLTKCHHDSQGPPLKSFIFPEARDDAHQLEQYVQQTVAAIHHVDSSFPDMNLHVQLAIVVPDVDFRNRFVAPLQQKLLEAFPGRTLKLVDAATASSACVSNAVSVSPSDDQEEWIVLDVMTEMDGLEYLMCICTGLDVAMDAEEGNMLETRSMLYRAITRAVMMAMAVNEL